MKTDADFVTIKLLKLLKLRFNRDKLINLLQKHNHYPSLASINDTLKNLGIATYPVKIDIDQLETQDFPIISHLSFPDNKFIIIDGYSKEKQEVSYIIKSNIFKKETIKKFNQKWSGIIINIDRGDKLGLLKYLKEWAEYNVQNLLIILFSLLVCSGIISSAFQFGSDLKAFIMIPKLFGLIISLTISIKESFADNDWLSNICKSKKIFNCDKVLNSRFSRIFNLVTLTDIATVYFIFTTSLFIIGYKSIYFYEIWLTLFFLNSLGIPVIVYSLYSQIFKTKAFCPFCLLIIGAYLAELLLLNIKHYEFNFTIGYFISYELLISISIIVFYSFFKKMLLAIWRNKSNKELKILKWFTDIPGLIDLTIKQQKKISNDISEEYKLGIINSKAQVKLIVVINPKCPHCESMALELNDIINKYRQLISLEIRFNSHDQISIILTEILRKNKGFEAWNAYIFYIQKGEVALKHKYFTKENISKLSEEINQIHNNWCEDLDINSTPMVILNNKIVPPIFYNEKIFIKYLNNFF